MSCMKKYWLPIAVGIVGSSLFLIGLEWLFWPIQQEQVETLRQLTQQVNQEIMSDQKQITKWKKQAIVWHQERQHGYRSYSLFSQYYDSARLVKYFADIAQTAGVKIHHIEWRSEVEIDGALQSPFSLELSGHYLQVSQFFRLVSKHPPVIVFTQVLWNRASQSSDQIDVQAEASSFHWLQNREKWE
jgi:Tfp pilus assembly protein PilO